MSRCNHRWKAPEVEPDSGHYHGEHVCGLQRHAGYHQCTVPDCEAMHFCLPQFCSVRQLRPHHQTPNVPTLRLRAGPPVQIRRMSTQVKP